VHHQPNLCALSGQTPKKFPKIGKRPNKPPFKTLWRQLFLSGYGQISVPFEKNSPHQKPDRQLGSDATSSRKQLTPKYFSSISRIRLRQLQHGLKTGKCARIFPHYSIYELKISQKLTKVLDYRYRQQTDRRGPLNAQILFECAHSRKVSPAQNLVGNFH